MRSLRVPRAYPTAAMGKKHKSEAPDPVDLAHGNGTILKVKLTNFMCHHNLEVEFGPRINFLVGENGSGKSAVLTALSLTLGVKAKETRRSEKGIKGFIREGANFAKVEVSIRNVGHDALDPDVFGPVIVIERNISQSTSSIKIKGRDGKDVGGSRDKLDRITDHFNIDVNNPVVVMSQDSSREFLHSGKPGDKYDFFTKATLLKEITNKLMYIKQQIKEMNALIAEKEKELPVVEEELARLDEEKNSYNKLTELRNKVTEFRDRLAWAAVYDLEREQAAAEEQIKQYEDLIPKVNEILAKNTRLAEEENAKAAAADEQFRAASLEVQKVIDERLEAEKKVVAVKRQIKGKNTDVLLANNALQAAQMDVDSCEGQVKEFQESIAAASQAQDTRLQKAVDSAAGRLEQAKQAKANAEDEEARNQRDTRDAGAKEAQMMGRVRYVQDDIGNLESSLKNSKLEGNKALLRYGNKMPELVEKIKKLPDGYFNSKPIGPVGAYVKLKDQMWATAVEEKIGGKLATFLVGDHQDRAKLAKLMKDLGMTPIVSKVNFNIDKHAPSENQLPPAAYLKMTDVIEFQHDAVYNFLLDTTGIECTILVADQKEGATIVFDQRVRNVREACTKERVLERRGNSQLDYLMKPPRGRVIANNADHAKTLQIQIREKNNELKQLNADVRAATAAKHKLVKAQGDLKKKTQAASADVNRAKRELDEARGAQQATLGPTQVNIEQLEADLEAALTLIEPAEEAVRKAEEALAALKEAERKAEEEHGRLAAITSDKSFTERVEELQNEHEAYTVAANTAKNMVQSCTDRINDVQARLAHQTAEKNALAVQISRSLEIAKKCCNRDTATGYLDEGAEERPMNELEREHARAMNRVEKEKAAYKRPEAEVLRNYEDAKRKFTRLEKTIKSSRGPCDRLNAGRKKRMRLLTETAHGVTVQVSHRFNYHMAKKGHAGQVKVDFRRAELNLDVKMNGAGQTVKDTRSMSGGERSYATLALTLALGENVESPFRAMDEFDVFMDAVNRKISMDALIEFARDPNNSDKQYLFITPQDISAVDAGASDIVVQRMQAARPQR